MQETINDMIMCWYQIWDGRATVSLFVPPLFQQEERVSPKKDQNVCFVSNMKKETKLLIIELLQTQKSAGL